jgi:gluconolactonase
VRAAVGTAVLIILFIMAAHAQAPSGLVGVVAPGAEPELVQEGFTFTEGPVGSPEGGLYFSDIRANRIYYLDPNGRINSVREQTNGANGLALTHDGELLAADGKPLMAPNDLIVDSKGAVYFTDPGPRPLVPGRTAYVYYLPAGAKQPTVIDDQITRPNGLTLTGDGKTLIVDDSVGSSVYAYDVQPDGSVKSKRTFAQLRDFPEGKESGADGMALDRDGRLYVTTVIGIQVFDVTGRYLGTIKVPRQPANAGFAGPDKRMLYITAREGLYRLKMLAQGPDRVGK